MPRYLLMGVCLYKTLSIYDKSKQLVAINQMNHTMTIRKGKQLGKYFSNEEEFFDLVTKRMIEEKDYSDDEDDLDDDQPKFGYGAASFEASKKTMN